VHAHRSPAHALIALVLAGCGSSDPGEAAAGDDPPVANARFPEGWNAAPLPVLQQDTTERIALGRLLFYDPVVSYDGQTACATCHSEVWGMSDALSVSVGHGAGLLGGPGRHGSNETRRNSPTLWNVGYYETYFWDGRASSLEDQVHFPFEATEEFDRPFADVVADIAKVPAYVPLFAAAFPDRDAVTAESFAGAVAAFERTLVSRRGLYDSYVAGDEDALGDAGKRGLFLFAEEGCVTCHAPPLFASNQFADRGIAPIPGVADDGRAEITGDAADSRHYKVPTLRNVLDTGPFFHTGAMATIDDAVKQELARSVEADGARVLEDDETSDLVSFVSKALNDAKNTPTRPKEVPSGLPVPIDGLNLVR
jgi:cytochrome c peroxidase